MNHRAPPGAQVSAGRLRVDAARAIAKLREYQLVDRTWWVLEAIRAAVASGATAIELRGDSNDVWLSWACTPWPAADLPRLFDELVSPEPGPERHHVRLLAAAVNSGLGLNPAYVDVIAIAAGDAMRARYTPDVLDVPASELGDAPLRKIEAVAVTAPAGTAPGMRVHLRRRAGLEVLQYFVRGARPPELDVAAGACEDIAVPLMIEGEAFERRLQRRDVVRLPLGDDLDGFIAIVDPDMLPPDARDAELEVAERGVVISVTSIDLDLGLGELHAALPIRVFVDAPRMPTNASRSEVRSDAHPIAAASARAREVIGPLFEQLARELSGEVISPRARAAFFALVASTMGSDWIRYLPSSGAFAALSKLPLLRDAAGTPRPLAWPWSGLVHGGDEPLPAELAPWLDNVLWIPPGDQAIRLLRGGFVDARAMRRYLREARRERRAEKRFYAHAPRPARVDAKATPRMRVPLGVEVPESCVIQHRFAGLHGEVCLIPGQSSGGLVLLLDGREIESVRFDSAIGYEAVIDGAKLEPVDRYRGVVHDAEFTRVVDALRAGVVRAVEVLALQLAGAELPAGCQGAPDRAIGQDARLVRKGIAFAAQLELQVPFGCPLSAAPAWRASAKWYAADQLRGVAVIGVAPPGIDVEPPSDRVVLYLLDEDRETLAWLLPSTHFIAYGGTRARATVPRALAGQLSAVTGVALGVRDDDVVGAIGPSQTTSRVLVYHRGAQLAEHAYEPRIVPCVIAVDSERVVPEADWLSARDDAGLGGRDYSRWERKLVREAAFALCGHPSAELAGFARCELSSHVGELVCTAVNAAADPKELLGAELLATLRAMPLVRVLGDAHNHSIDAIAKANRQGIYFVDSSASPVPEFSPIIAGSNVAHAIAKLADRRCADGSIELARRRDAAVRAQHLELHRARPLREIALPGVHVSVERLLGRGIVGVGDSFRVEVIVEGRLFATIERAAELPLHGIVEIEARHTDSTFVALQSSAADQLVSDVRRMLRPLLIAIARAQPEKLADLGPPRTLLAAALDRRRLDQPTRDELRGLVRFRTVAGERITLDAACRPDQTVPIATWNADWLAAEAGEAADPLDSGVVQVPDTELGNILARLDRELVDVTDALTKLQAQRRMARGLLPAPMVRGVAAELVMRLGDLGPLARELGPGEIALVEGDALALLHQHGEPASRIAIDVLPSIHLAIEAPDLIAKLAQREHAEPNIDEQLRALRGEPVLTRHPELAALTAVAQPLALVLARAVIERLGDTIPPAIRRRLAQAVLAGRLPPAELANARVFETVTGVWIDWRAVTEQSERFGNVWTVQAIPAEATPLDEHRLVLVLDRDTAATARLAKHPFVDATMELALDATARRNRARPRTRSLAIEGRDGILAEVELAGDGVTAARGRVAILSPRSAGRRGIQPHRDMHPFDPLPDPCRWPTLSIVDDVRFTPDRTWQRPTTGPLWSELIERVSKASGDAVRSLVDIPQGVLASLRVSPSIYGGVKALRGDHRIQLRGAVWLAGPPLTVPSPSIEMIEADGTRAFVPLHGIGLGGQIYVVAPDGWDREAALEELCADLHAKLARTCAYEVATAVDRDVFTAHVAHALALRRIEPVDARRLKLACFWPEPLDAVQLVELLRSTEPVTIVDPGDDQHGTRVLIDDGSHTSRVILSALGARARRPSTRRPEARSEPVEARPTGHPLDIMLHPLRMRLAAIGIDAPPFGVAERSDPIVEYDNHVLWFAAEHRLVLAVGAACVAKDAWANAAVDALAAHVVSVLNIALTEITDTTEAGAIALLLGAR